MLSNKSKYAIRAVIFIAYKSQFEANPIGGKYISEHLKMPLPFTVKILQELVKGNIISSLKGPGGGFFLNEENEKKNLMDLITVFGDDKFFSACALGLPECSDERPCPVHEDFGKCRANIRKIFEGKTLCQLARAFDEETHYLV
jgi:Rrf2 family iron-sulfur cluster assembly transcriptional regulator